MILYALALDSKENKQARLLLAIARL
jgi:hypothetical protein